MSKKEEFNRNNKLSNSISVFVSEEKSTEAIDLKEIDSKISKLNSMIKNVERRIDSHQRRLSTFYENVESREAREHMHKIESKISANL